MYYDQGRKHARNKTLTVEVAHPFQYPIMHDFLRLGYEYPDTLTLVDLIQCYDSTLELCAP